MLQPAVTRSALTGFLFSGLLMSFLGAVLPVWGYHIHTNSLRVGAYFLAQTVGLLLSPAIGPRLLRRKGTSYALALACALAAAGLVELGFVAPPVHYLWRMAGLLITGTAAGLLNMALFHAITPAYELDPASTLNIGGTFFGLGCLITALIVSGTYYVKPVWLVFVLLAAPAALGSWLYARQRAPTGTVYPQPSWRQASAEFKGLAAVLFALLLFFQFGNEWALAGWLPLFISQRLGTSPSTALLLLAVYWLALLLGRFGAQYLLPRVSHARMLVGSVLAPLFGSSVLSFTDNLMGVVTGILFLGAGFALIYPLVMEKIGYRFPRFHPGVFNGIFSIGVVGGLLSPATIGVYAHFWGVGAAVTVPLLGSIMVFLLLLLLMLEAHLSGRPNNSTTAA